MRPEWLHVMVSVVLRVLHLQGHDLLLLTVSQVVGGSTPLWRQPVASHLMSLVTLVVKGGKGKDVKEEEGRPHGNCHTQLSGVVPGVTREEVLVWTLRTLGLRIRWEGRVGVTSGGRARCFGPGSVGSWTRAWW